MRVGFANGIKFQDRSGCKRNKIFCIVYGHRPAADPVSSTTQTIRLFIKFLFKIEGHNIHLIIICIGKGARIFNPSIFVRESVIPSAIANLVNVANIKPKTMTDFIVLLSGVWLTTILCSETVCPKCADDDICQCD
jgi:hypothetical protein